MTRRRAKEADRPRGAMSTKKPEKNETANARMTHDERKEFDENLGERESASPAPDKPSLAWLGMLVGGALAVALVLFGMSLLRTGLPDLTRAEWTAARERWMKAGPESYTIEIHVTEPQESLYRVEVRDRRVESATRNGDPLPERRTWETWRVEGMFDTIESDLETNETVAKTPGAGGLDNLVLRARFDEQYGYPAEYQRTQFNPPFDAAWQVTLFEVQP